MHKFWFYSTKVENICQLGKNTKKSGICPEADTPDSKNHLPKV